MPQIMLAIALKNLLHCCRINSKTRSQKNTVYSATHGVTANQIYIDTSPCNATNPLFMLATMIHFEIKNPQSIYNYDMYEMYSNRQQYLTKQCLKSHILTGRYLFLKVGKC